MLKRFFHFLLVILFLADMCYSFAQYLGQPLDGDMTVVIIPSEQIKPLMESPLGADAVLNDRYYANPNRFFCHWSMYRYFRAAPALLQYFTGPIESVYLACAIAKIMIHFLLVALLAAAITGSFKWYSIDFLLAALLVTPLFQANGYAGYMGIIDASTTYTFFYALPCVLLFVYLLPLFLQLYHDRQNRPGLLARILWLPLAFMVCLSGPLNPGVILVFSFLLFLYRIRNNYIALPPGEKRIIRSLRNIPVSYGYYLMPVCLLSLYSLYIGRYNINNIDIPVSGLFLKLPEGIYYQFTQKPGFPVLFATLIINAILISRNDKTGAGRKILTVLKWLGIFSLIYILLLPFGGYRVYRPLILRYDTIMPITLGLIFMFGSTTFFLLKSIPARQKTWYIPFIIFVWGIYIIADEEKFYRNKCERTALEKIAASEVPVVPLYMDCSIVSWELIKNPEDSERQAMLLQLWGITRNKKLYYQLTENTK